MYKEYWFELDKNLEVTIIEKDNKEKIEIVSLGKISDTQYVMGNTTFDLEYNIISDGWKNTGTGTNPDGSQANIGVYGGEFAW